MKRLISAILSVCLLFCFCGCEKSDTYTNNSNEVATPENEPAVIEKDLPKVKFLAENANVIFRDMVNLPGGGFAVSAVRQTSEQDYSIIQVYNNKAEIEKEYSYKNSGGFDKITVCSDGGFVAVSYSPPCVTKIDSNFKMEWNTTYEDIDFPGTVQDIEEISPDLIAVLFVSVNSPDYSRRLKIAFLDKQCRIVKTVDLMENVDPQDAEIIADGKGGFHLITTCNKSLADKYPLISDNYDSSKLNEVAIMHFSAEIELTDAKIFGGEGNDWIEESAIDNNGSIYLAMGTNHNGMDAFWEMDIDQTLPYRRMLVKLDKNGKIIYKAPLSKKGMAVDQIFGIHIKDDKAYVVGASDYFDGYQEKYPCKQISDDEKDDRVFCVYRACIDGNGKELGRKIFRCHMNNTPCDFTLLPNGYSVIAGSVVSFDNPFNLDFPAGTDLMASLFLYEDL